MKKIQATDYWLYWIGEASREGWDWEADMYISIWPALYYGVGGDPVDWDLQTSAFYWSAICGVLDPYYSPR